MTRRMDWAELRAEYAERSAILEFDNHVPRAEAERQAAREIYDSLQAQPAEGLIAELAKASRVRWDPQLVPVIEALGLANTRAPAWGFDWVVHTGATYRPARPDETGRAALIVPAVEGSETDGSRIVDLVCYFISNHDEEFRDVITFDGRPMASRYGNAAVLGVDQLERARESRIPLFVFDNILSWLQAGTRGCVVIDWHQAASLLDCVHTILCSQHLADRLLRVIADCSLPPDVLVLKGPPHAA